MKTFDQSFPTWGACPTGRVQQYFGRAQVGHAPLKESHGPPYSTLLYVLKIYLFKYPFVLNLLSFINAMFFGTLFRYQVDDKRGIFIIKIKYHKRGYQDFRYAQVDEGPKQVGNHYFRPSILYMTYFYAGEIKITFLYFLFASKK